MPGPIPRQQMSGDTISIEVNDVDEMFDTSNLKTRRQVT